MTTYHITAWCSVPHYTTFEIEARNTREALRKARKKVTDEYPEPCNGANLNWDEFELRPDDEYTRAITRFEPSRQIANAAEDLLNAAQFTLPVLEILTCTRENEQERKAYNKVRRAINKAIKR